MTATTFIAHRDLLVSEKGGQKRNKVRVKVTLPSHVTQTTTGVELGEGASMCKIVFDGLEEADLEIYGTDSLQALSLATDIEELIRGLSKRYDFFWATGEPYFEDESS
jgi:hypothetical protein